MTTFNRDVTIMILGQQAKRHGTIFVISQPLIQLPGQVVDSVLQAKCPGIIEKSSQKCQLTIRSVRVN